MQVIRQFRSDPAAELRALRLLLGDVFRSGKSTRVAEASSDVAGAGAPDGSGYAMHLPGQKTGPTAVSSATETIEYGDETDGTVGSAGITSRFAVPTGNV